LGWPGGVGVVVDFDQPRWMEYTDTEQR
jgi:hypothetical protein